MPERRLRVRVAARYYLALPHFVSVLKIRIVSVFVVFLVMFEDFQLSALKLAGVLS